MYIEYNPNPVGRFVGDCSVRAVAKALGIDWETAYVMISANGYLMGDVISSDAVWGAVLREHGFYRTAIPTDAPEYYTVEDFAKDNPVGTYVLGTGNHVVTVVDGDIYDTWDSSREIPQYVWHRKD